MYINPLKTGTEGRNRGQAKQLFLCLLHYNILLEGTLVVKFFMLEKKKSNTEYVGTYVSFLDGFSARAWFLTLSPPDLRFVVGLRVQSDVCVRLFYN